MQDIIHISDLHYTRADNPKGDASRMAANGISTLVTDLLTNNVISKSAIIAFTGDIVFNGSIPESFDHLHEDLLQPLCEAMHIEPSAVIIAPGNHDLDRGKILEGQYLVGSTFAKNEHSLKNLGDDLTLKLANYFDFIEKYGYSSVSRDQPRIKQFEPSTGNFITVFNGLAGSYSRPTNGDRGQLFTVEVELPEIFAAIKNNSVVLSHHPLSWYYDTCAETLEKHLISKNAVLLTGHLHSDRVREIGENHNSLKHVAAGIAGGENAQPHLSVIWIAPSGAMAVRGYEFDTALGKFPLKDVEATIVTPRNARGFFENTEAFYSSDIFKKVQKKMGELVAEQLDYSLFAKKPEDYIIPDISKFSDSNSQQRQSNFDNFVDEVRHRIVSGADLSGKTCFLLYAAWNSNINYDRCVHCVINYRRAKGNSGWVLNQIKSEFNKAENGFKYLNYYLENGLVDLYLDDFSSSDGKKIEELKLFIEKYSKVRITFANYGDSILSHSLRPSALHDLDLAFYELSTISTGTVKKVISQSTSSQVSQNDLALVERVFRSIHNLQAPRTIFYVQSFVDMYLSDGAVEPLNHYLLVENLLSDRIRHAHSEESPTAAFDSKTMEAFVGFLAHWMFEEDILFFSKDEFHQKAAEFKSKKGVREKDFNTDTVFNILTKSYVLRQFHDGYAFSIVNFENFFLAMHMKHDEEFQRFALSPEGLLKYSSAVGYFIAENPSDKTKINVIFSSLDKFIEWMSVTIDELDASVRPTFENLSRGDLTDTQDTILAALTDAENPDYEQHIELIHPDQYRKRGNSGRYIHSPQEIGLVLFRVCSVTVGLARTLDEKDKIALFKRLKPLISLNVLIAPIWGQHLAKGGTISYRDNVFEAQFAGTGVKEEDYLFVITKSLTFGILQLFGLYTGNGHFYEAAKKLRAEEDDEIIKAALLVQNFEADSEESIASIAEVNTEISSPILKEVLIDIFVDILKRVPLPKPQNDRAVEMMTNVLIELQPVNPKQMDLAKDNIRRNIQLGMAVSEYKGIGIKPRKKRPK